MQDKLPDTVSQLNIEGYLRDHGRRKETRNVKMKYVSLPDLTQHAAEGLVYNEAEEFHKRRTAVLWLVRFGEPARAIEIVEDLVERHWDALAYPGVSLLDLPIQFGGCRPNIPLIKRWMDRFSDENPSDRKGLEDTLELIEMAMSDLDYRI